MAKVSIILLNYNGEKFNIPCIDSIITQSYQDFEIIFVDNASTDKSLEEVKNTYYKEIRSGKIIIVESKINTMVCKGYNLGAEHANKESKYICILNNDVTVPSDRLEELTNGIESNTKFGAVSGLVLDQGHEDKVLQMYNEKKNVFTINIFGETVIRKASEEECKKGIYETQNIPGCGILYKKAIIKKPFPEFYVAYAEDNFLCLHILKMGYKLGMCTKAIVHHFGSGSFGKEPSNFKLFYGNRNQIINLLVFYKNTTFLKLLPLFLITQTGHLFINAFKKRLRAKIKARWWIITHTREISNLKKQIQKDTVITEKEFIHNISYKFSDNLFWANFSKTKIKIIEKMNTIFIFYLNLILYRK